MTLEQQETTREKDWTAFLEHYQSHLSNYPDCCYVAQRHLGQIIYVYKEFDGGYHHISLNGDYYILKKLKQK